MKLLENKVAIITGGSKGIGKSIVNIFYKEGAKIYFTYYNSYNSALKIEKSLNFKKVKSYYLDINNKKSIKNFIKKVITESGKIDIIVNNIGITKDNIIFKISKKDWDDVININLTSFFMITKEISKFMIMKRSGSIINISSVIGIIGNKGQSNYSASKAGIIGFTKSIAKELGPKNIRCNVIAPGFINTEMTFNKINFKEKIKNIPLRKIGTTEDVAKTALFLASDLSSYITSEVINVNGGMY